MASRRTDLRGSAREQLPLLLFVSILFTAGVVFGAMIATTLSLGQQQDLNRYLHGYFDSLASTGEGFTPFSLLADFLPQLKWLLLIWVLGLSVIGLPLVLLLDFLKGVLVGFSIAFLAGQFSWKGLLFVLLAIIPQDILLIPTLLILSVFSIACSLKLVRNHMARRRIDVPRLFGGYSLAGLALVLPSFAAAVLETYVSPALIRSVAPMMLQGFGG